MTRTVFGVANWPRTGCFGGEPFFTCGTGRRAPLYRRAGFPFLGEFCRDANRNVEASPGVPTRPCVTPGRILFYPGSTPLSWVNPTCRGTIYVCSRSISTDPWVHAGKTLLSGQVLAAQEPPRAAPPSRVHRFSFQSGEKLALMDSGRTTNAPRSHIPLSSQRFSAVMKAQHQGPIQGALFRIRLA